MAEVEKEIVDSINKGRRLTSRKVTTTIFNVTIVRGMTCKSRMLEIMQKMKKQLQIMAYKNDTAASTDICFLDSGCSNHMTVIKSLFKQLNKSYNIKVGLCDDKQVQVEGRGIVAINKSSGDVKLI